MTVRKPQPDVVVRAEDFPGLGADTARYINERVRPEWRAAVAANVAAAPPLTDSQRATLAAIASAKAARRAPGADKTRPSG